MCRERERERSRVIPKEISRARPKTRPPQANSSSPWTLQTHSKNSHILPDWPSVLPQFSLVVVSRDNGLTRYIYIYMYIYTHTHRPWATVWHARSWDRITRAVHSPTHKLQIDLSAPAAFYFRLVLETSCIVNAPRTTWTHPVSYFPLYTHNPHTQSEEPELYGNRTGEAVRVTPNLSG